MRIALDQEISGFSAVRVRRLMRKAVGRSITARYVREILDCSSSDASRMLRYLLEDGFVEFVGSHLERSTKGSALALATAARPLRRETAARLVAELIERARALNADDKWAYRIRTVVVFGSYIRGAERPNDVDIACELRPRWTGAEQLVQEQVRREIRRQPFRNLTEWAAWPRLEVFRFLKACARGLSIHELEEWILQTTEHKVLFRDESGTTEDC
jgi:predicted nucleotidyltransferase